MRILMLNNEFPPIGGGTGSVNKALLDCFAGVADQEIDLVTSATGRRREEYAYAERIRIIRLPVNSKNLHHSTAPVLVAYALNALQEARRLHSQEPYDFCFAWSAVPAGWIALRLKQRMGLRYLVRVCGVDIPGFEKRYRFVYPLLAPVLRRVWREAEAVVVKCRGEEEMIRAVAPEIKPHIIPNGVDPNQFRPARISPDGSPLRLICVGRLIERKGQRDLIETMSRLTSEGVDLHLTLVGTGDAEPAYRRLVSKKHLEERVIFRGYVPREKIAQEYAQADVFVLPSHNEGMSVSTLEAMASGLPLVVSRTGGTEELVEENGNGFTFQAGDVGLLVRRLRSFSRDRSLLMRMAACSRRKAIQFSWDSVCESYLHVFPSAECGPHFGCNGVEMKSRAAFSQDHVR